jgi:glycosyltransferase involved in cell wall biosynthesis
MSYISITVLIPCYNGAETIERCFDAVLSQNYPKEYLKILCIDDGSIDDSFQIIKSIQEKYPERIKVIQQTNHGIAYTRQKLLENVATPYFIFCDADDYFLDDAINKLVKASNNGGADAVVAKAYRISKRKHRRV